MYNTTHVNVSDPHPAIAVNILGLRSRAGLNAPPQFIPKVMVRATTMKPTLRAVTPLDGCMLWGSVMANIQIISIPVANV